MLFDAGRLTQLTEKGSFEKPAILEPLLRFSRSIWAEIEGLTAYLPLIDAITKFWVEPVNQRSENWRSHADINAVMLATSLAPDELPSFEKSVYPAFANVTGVVIGGHLLNYDRNQKNQVRSVTLS